MTLGEDWRAPLTLKGLTWLRPPFSSSQGSHKSVIFFLSFPGEAGDNIYYQLWKMTEFTFRTGFSCSGASSTRRCHAVPVKTLLENMKPCYLSVFLFSQTRFP